MRMLYILSFFIEILISLYILCFVQKTEELRQLLQTMWNQLDQATSSKYEKMEAEDKTR